MPLYAWHNRLVWDEPNNEFPWGAGIGRSFHDEDGDLHALYAIGFSDSNYDFQPFAGYMYQANWALDEARDWRAGVGFLLGVTAREKFGYIPFPAPLPLAGIEYKDVALHATYVPGGYEDGDLTHDGNVLFIWLRWHF